MNDTAKSSLLDKEEEIRDPRRKREIIKTILIIFLAALLVLTFCSNTIMNKSLAEINTERATSGKLTEKLEVNGTVLSSQSYDVKVDSNLVIDTVMIKVGKEVKKDDVLFTVSTEENEDIQAAQKELEELQLDYQKEISKSSKDYYAENKAISEARAALNAAIAKRDAAQRNQGAIAANKATLKELKAELARNTKLKDKLETTITAIDTDSPSQAAPEYSTDLINLQQAAANAEKEYNSALSLYTAMLSGGKGADEEGGANISGSVTPEAIEAARADSEAKKTTYDQAKTAYDNYRRDFRAQLIEQHTACENTIDTLNSQIESFEENGSGEGESLETLNEAVQSCQKTLDEAIATLNKTKSDDSNQSKLDALDLGAKQKAIERAQQKLDKLREKNTVTEIRSKYSGIVNSVNIKSGDTAVPDSPLAVIDLSEDGYTLEIPVDGEKTKKLKKGSVADVTNNWGKDITATLTDIKNDTTPGSKNRTLVFTVTGEVTSGTYLELSIPSGTGNYDCIVPKSALQHDRDSDFVLIVESKSSPLGNRYYAERVNIEILAQDETSAAITGDITSGEYVITTASKYIEPRDQVRMKDK
ncbi:MAG: efflux RND transporter periplasmic adaptor subunit [Ruminococcus sp.]|nr:efflux RND transporter periplasmic adaptor subunit [Ruminococcus sp.]